MPMLAEQQILNMALTSKDWSVITENGLDLADKEGVPLFFPALRDPYEWIISYKAKNKQLPTPHAVRTEFDEFEILTDLDGMDYLLTQLREDFAYRELYPELENIVKQINSGDAIGSLNLMQNISQNVLNRLSIKGGYYDWAMDSMKRYAEYLDRHGKSGLLGITTGLPLLDDITAGIRNNDFIVVPARLSNGKTWWGLHFGLTTWRSQLDADLYALEMDEDEYGTRLDTMHGHWDNKQLQTGRLPDPEMYKEYLENLSEKKGKLRIYTTEHNGNMKYTPDDIRARAERNGSHLIMIDQASKLETNKPYRSIREKFLTISGELRQITIDLKKPIILLVQAGRDSAKEMRKSDKATVELEHIQETDAFAQDATRVFMLRKTGEYFKLSVKKNRGGIENVDVFVKWDVNTGIMEQTTEDEMVF